MGPLKGIKILEVGGIGPGPFCGMLLSDMGAEVVRLVRKGEQAMVEQKYEVLNRGRRSVGIDMKNPAGIETVLKLIEKADALQEGFRPGVMEKLGLGPDVCLKRNQKLVYGRMTGWGQEGPLSQTPGHDINYIALAGALNYIGKANERPTLPINLLGDFGGGGMFLAFGMVCALLDAQRTGKGQVVDASMVDGTTILMAIFYGLNSGGMWNERGNNVLDGGAYFYNTYETADGKYVSIGSFEPKFYRELLRLTGLENDPDFKPENQMDSTTWPEKTEKMAAVFKAKTRDEWCEIMEGSNVCFAPVLSMDEAVKHPHNAERKTFIEIDGITQPNPAPRFSRTKCEIQCPPPDFSADTVPALKDWGFTDDEINNLKSAGAIE